MSGYQPRIVAFACNYCAYAAADLAGALRLAYPPSVRVVRLPCTGRIDSLALLRAFEAGADAVLVAGCHLGECHFIRGNEQGKAAVAFTKRLLAEIGLDERRLEFFHVAASEARGWVSAVEQMTRRAQELGPSPLRPGAPGAQGPEGGQRVRP